MEEMAYSRRRIEELLADHTGQPIEKVSADIERDYIVRGDDAVEYGLVDAIVTQRELVSATATPAIAPGY